MCIYPTLQRRKLRLSEITVEATMVINEEAQIESMSMSS